MHITSELFWVKPSTVHLLCIILRVQEVYTNLISQLLLCYNLEICIKVTPGGMMTIGEVIVLVVVRDLQTKYQFLVTSSKIENNIPNQLLLSRRHRYLGKLQDISYL